MGHQRQSVGSQGDRGGRALADAFPLRKGSRQPDPSHWLEFRSTVRWQPDTFFLIDKQLFCSARLYTTSVFVFAQHTTAW